MLKLVSKSQDDLALIEQFKSGNENAFKLLVNKHKEKIRNLIWLTLGNSNHTDDLAQEVFLKVYYHVKDFRGDAQFTTWLYRTTTNFCRDELRKKRLRKMFVFFDESSNGSQPYRIEEIPQGKLQGENHTEKNNIQEIVRQGLAKLPDKLSVPLILKDIEGFSYQEIAKVEHCGLGTVKSRIFRAREALRDILKPLKNELIF